MPNPKWTVIESREDLIPGRLSVVYRLDDGQTFTTHFPPDWEETQCEETMSDTWLSRSQSSEAHAERIAKGKVPKLKKEHFKPGKVNKEARDNGVP